MVFRLYVSEVRTEFVYDAGRFMGQYAGSRARIAALM